jgi:hypothetical protein
MQQERKMTTPKCRHFPLRGISGISRPDLVIEKSTEQNKAGRWHQKIKNDGTEVPPFPLQGLPGFPDRISPIKRVAKTYCSENP